MAFCIAVLLLEPLFVPDTLFALGAGAAGGPRLTAAVRLVPVSPALLSYALGAAGVPLRSAALGNLAMFVHMLPTLYFGAAAVHVTRMAETGHTQWERDAILGMFALGVAVALALWAPRRRRSAGDAVR